MRLDVERREVLDQLLEKNMKKYCEEDSSEEEVGKSETVDAEEESGSEQITRQKKNR